MKNQKLNLALAVLCGALIGAALTLVVGSKGGSGKLAAPSGPEIENYVPIIMQDNGYYSAKGIYTTSTFQADGAATFGNSTTTYGSSAIPTYRTIGGIDYADVQLSIAATSSVFCSVSNPFGTATTGVMTAMSNITGGMTTAQSYDISTSTQSGAGSSTPAFIYARSVGANKTDFTLWEPRATSSQLSPNILSTPESGSASPFFLASTNGLPDRLTWRVATGTPGNQTYSGTCSATFMKP